MSGSSKGSKSDFEGFKDFNDWNKNNKSPLVSDHRTSGGTTTKDNSSIGWQNYYGTKDSHDVTVNQYNIKDTETGSHKFFNPKSGWGGIIDKDNKDKK